MRHPEGIVEDRPPSLPSLRLRRTAKGFATTGAVLCGLLVLMIVTTVIADPYFRHGGQQGLGPIGLALFYALMIPTLFLPVAVVCFVGMVLSVLSRRQQASSDARIALLLSVAAPAVVFVCYLAGLPFIIK